MQKYAHMTYQKYADMVMHMPTNSQVLYRMSAVVINPYIMCIGNHCWSLLQIEES